MSNVHFQNRSKEYYPSISTPSTSHSIRVAATNRLVPSRNGVELDNVMHEEEVFHTENLDNQNQIKRKYVKRKRHVTIHECKYCGKVLQYPSKIAEHMRTHTGDRPFTCSICEATFTQAGPLKAHLRSHNNIKPFNCRTCHKAFTTSSNRSSHEKSCSKKSVNVVPTSKTNIFDPNIYMEKINEPLYDPMDYVVYDDDVFSSPNRIMVSTVEELIENSDESITYYVTNGLEEQNFSNVHSLKFFKRSDGSLVVGDQVLFPTVLDGHIVYNYADSGENFHFVLEDSNPILEYECNSEENNNENSQDVNVIYHHDDGVQENICEENAQFDEDYVVYKNNEYGHYEQIEINHDIHTPSIIPEVPVLADPRPPKKGRPKYLKAVQHELYIEVPTEIFELAAPKQIRRPKNEHHQSPTDAKPARNLNWVIDAVAKNLPLEEASPHVRKRPQIYTCEVCGQSIKYPSKIEAHKRTHTGERPFTCEICGMSFTQKTTLRMHLRRHLNHKPFCCNIDGCTKSFISGALLNEHVQKRHADHRFACLRNCGRIFSTNRDRQKHEQQCISVVSKSGGLTDNY